MCVLVTGAAGFIGYHVTRALLDRGERVVGVDNLNDYYDPKLKRARLDALQSNQFICNEIDVGDWEAVKSLFQAEPGIDRVVHLAAKPGVRHSFVDPHAYLHSNVLGQLNIMEASRRWPKMAHVIYASSSSVYNSANQLPFAVSDRADCPLSIHALSKRAGELMAEYYAGLFQLPVTGLRLFTIYGPWGRPDTAAYRFTKAILEERPIQVPNHGRIQRDFTYIDDVVAAMLTAIDRPPAGGEDIPPHRLYNLGNDRSDDLMHVIEVIEQACGRSVVKEFVENEPGEVEISYAEIDDSRQDLGFEPRTPIEDGLPRFVAWYREYHGV